MNLLVELEPEDDGRWIADVVDLPGVMAYGATREEALVAVKALALRVLADRIEHGELSPDLPELTFGIKADKGGVSRWPSTRARRVLAALFRIGWSVKRTSGADTMDPELFGGLTWRLLGPFRAGRVLAVAGVPGEPAHFYFGSVPTASKSDASPWT